MKTLALLLLTGTTCLAGFNAPLPKIKTGTSHQPVLIKRDPWYVGYVSESNAVLVGEVLSVSEDVVTSPQKIVLSESCEVRVEAAFGHRAELQGIRLAKLQSDDEQSPYVPVDPNWGRLRHLKAGQKIIVLLDAHEQKPSFGSEMLLEIDESTRSLPDILRRTGLDPGRFTLDDLRVLKATSPVVHDQVFKEGAAVRERLAQESQRHSRVIAIIAGAIVIVLVAFRSLRKGKRAA